MIGVIFAALGGTFMGAIGASVVYVAATEAGLPEGPGWWVLVIPWLTLCAYAAVKVRDD